MTRPIRLIDRGLAVMAVLALAACTPGGPAETPSAAPSRAPSASPSPPPADGDASTEVLIECTYPDGTVAGTFTRLEEAWASTNYVRFEACTAETAAAGEVELAEPEEVVAEIAAADLPDADPVDLYLRVLAACARIAPDGDEGIAGSPTSVLEAILELCPEAPQSGLVAAELSGRG